MKSLIRKILPLIDILLFPFIIVPLFVFKYIRKAGVENMKLCRKLFFSIGVFPVTDFYYEPNFNPKNLIKPLDEPRLLPGIDLNAAEQLELFSKFNYNDELLSFPLKAGKELSYFYDNSTFGSGDAELLYCMIRHFKPRRMIEIGSGNSTLMAIYAIKKNNTETSTYSCSHICIEPYEMPWLKDTGVELIRKRVELIDPQYFRQLEANDILFIDSSHVIRPQGDVLFEYLEILPLLKSGVVVHIHDIFTPRDYPKEWVEDSVRLWNEQYLLEAFLSGDSSFKIIGALNYLKHNNPEEVFSKLPILNKNRDREPGSFWLMKK